MNRLASLFSELGNFNLEINQDIADAQSARVMATQYQKPTQENNEIDSSTERTTSAESLATQGMFAAVAARLKNNPNS